VTIHESQIPLSGAAFTFNAEPLSMNAIEICKSAPPQVSVAYAGNMASLSWNAVPGAESYVVQWGPSAANPTGGTAKYPGVKGTVYLTVTAVKPDGTSGPPSDVVSAIMP